MSIYTRTGDNGQTSLFGGRRVLKCEELVDVYGSLDELNSWMGLLASRLDTIDVQGFIREIQEDLFAIGSALAGWKGLNEKTLLARVTQMEERIDLMESNLPKINNFILPGGSELGATVHVIRAVARRVERQTVALAQKEKITPTIIQYLNRLSDLLFVLARVVNQQQNAPEMIWS